MEIEGSGNSLARLMAGNQRYVNNELKHPNRSQESRNAVLDMQSPFAIVLGCSDSRVSPEIIFDQGIGDLFVVRVAGNVAGPLEVDSIELAAAHLGASLLLVLGHEGCGAVTAVVKDQAGDIASVARLIRPAVDAARKKPGDVLENAIEVNVRMVVAYLQTVPIIANLVKEGKLQIVGGFYHLKNGEVTIVETS